MSSIGILYLVGVFILGFNIFWNNKLYAEKLKLEDRERTLIHQATEGTLVKEKMLDFVQEFETDWLTTYEPEKQCRGLGKLRSNIIIWFEDQEKEKELFL